MTGRGQKQRGCFLGSQTSSECSSSPQRASAAFLRTRLKKPPNLGEKKTVLEHLCILYFSVQNRQELKLSRQMPSLGSSLVLILVIFIAQITYAAGEMHATQYRKNTLSRFFFGCIVNGSMLYATLFFAT